MGTSAQEFGDLEAHPPVAPMEDEQAILAKNKLVEDCESLEDMRDAAAKIGPMKGTEEHTVEKVQGILTQMIENPKNHWMVQFLPGAHNFRHKAKAILEAMDRKGK